ncbi:MAG: hypothetical protein A2664_03950 [Candidatus Taylorbacteria bacterium RIFCSPHIGHO2_01_FULL_46_22b]|uniref:DUF5671 domain-containing protein n=1 Tax=Candidatus Taylorbacteria bacterium RIFCSPHIGHO2_01_FULL_46_22b TaxID=1802301 RepID=A0A1G2M1J9_9BACT|nr:MAG: hypothetical protein A2664_03950 [Candidatus Taylorbacteria bacterium RIFCSPHIGHO2_01_FULL_46_22b]
MTKNPIYNALFAISYIVVLVTTVFNASNFLEGVVSETIFLPMSFLAVFVLSVALMAYLFFYQPVIMFLDGHREEGVKLFLKTVGAFAVATVLVIAMALAAGSMGIEGLK